MHKHTHHLIILLMIAGVFLAACGQTSIDTTQAIFTRSPTLTPSPTQISTPIYAPRTLAPSGTPDYFAAEEKSNTKTAIALTIAAIPRSTQGPKRTPWPSATLNPTAGPSPTQGPSPTSTQGPPLIAHEWIPEPIVIEWWASGGDGGGSFLIVHLT